MISKEFYDDKQMLLKTVKDVSEVPLEKGEYIHGTFYGLVKIRENTDGTIVLSSEKTEAIEALKEQYHLKEKTT